MTAGKVEDSIKFEAKKTGGAPPTTEDSEGCPLADTWIGEPLWERSQKVFSERYGEEISREETALLLRRIRAIAEFAHKKGDVKW